MRTMKGRVVQTSSNIKYPIVNAPVTLGPPVSKPVFSDSSGYYTVKVPDEGDFSVNCTAFGVQAAKPQPIGKGNVGEIPDLDFDLQLAVKFFTPANQPITSVTADQQLVMQLGVSDSITSGIASIHWKTIPEVYVTKRDAVSSVVVAPHGVSQFDVEGQVTESSNLIPPGTAAAYTTVKGSISVMPAPVQTVRVQEPLSVSLQRTALHPTLDQALWVAIENRTDALKYRRYERFINDALNQGDQKNVNFGGSPSLGMHFGKPYSELMVLSRAFVVMEAGTVRIEPGVERDELGSGDDPSVSLQKMQENLSALLGPTGETPIVRHALRRAHLECEDWSTRFIGARINQPCLVSLLHSLWLEEGGLHQTMNAICRRFQNVGARGGRDVLRNLNFDTLRSLSSLIWGWCQNECDRLSVLQRRYEYANQFGTLCGTNNAGMHPAHNGSGFRGAFHRLLRECAIFFKEDYETTRIADAYNVLFCLKEMNRLMTASTWQNQSMEMALQSRAETLMMQYVMGRQQTLNAFNVPLMSAYDEAWEPVVDAMTSLQGWGIKSASYYRDLAVYGEKIMLGVQFGDWQHVENADSAAHWLRFNRNHIKNFMSSYFAVTGIDLTNPNTVDGTAPELQSQRRTPMQQLMMQPRLR